MTEAQRSELRTLIDAASRHRVKRERRLRLEAEHIDAAIRFASGKQACCPGCQQPFVRKVPLQTYCSKGCAHDADLARRRRQGKALVA